MPRPNSYQGTATALQEAVDQNHVQLVPILLDRGADVNAPAAHGRRMALAPAARQDNSEILQVLLDHGASLKDQGRKAPRWSLSLSNMSPEGKSHLGSYDLFWTRGRMIAVAICNGLPTRLNATPHLS
jgi:ankyrin repeat protein